MMFEIFIDDMTGSIKFRGEIQVRDLDTLELSRLDRALLNDIGADQDSTSADYLLALETIFRRSEEQHLPHNTCYPNL